MIHIVPVPELLLQYSGEQEVKADPYLYAYFRDEVFLKEFSDFLIAKRYAKNKTTSDKKWFFSLPKLQQKLDRFEKKRNRKVVYKGKYYSYTVNSFEWNAINLFEFGSEEECDQFNEKNVETSTFILRLLKWIK